MSYYLIVDIILKKKDNKFKLEANKKIKLPCDIINQIENFEIFKKLLPNLHIVEFYGGEPLMQPEHKIIMNLIKECVDKQPIGLELFYNTNGTHYDEDAVEVWKKLFAVEINISLDIFNFDTGKEMSNYASEIYYINDLEKLKKLTLTSKKIIKKNKKNISQVL